MSSRVYPVEDPFPSQATHKLDVRDPRGPGPRANISTPPVEHIVALAEVYLKRFGLEEPGDLGQFVLVRGAHGTGKTHALGYVMDYVAARCTELGDEQDADERNPNIRDVLQLYVRLESPDFVAA
jgi:hypothetical protein